VDQDYRAPVTVRQENCQDKHHPSTRLALAGWAAAAAAASRAAPAASIVSRDGADSKALCNYMSHMCIVAVTTVLDLPIRTSHQQVGG
jgi:hypothetical protein